MLNQVMLVGRLVKDSEIGHKKDGKPYTRFTVANNRKFKEQEATTFIDVVVFRDLLLDKGDLVFVRGTLTMSDYEDKEGNKRRSFSIVAKEVLLLSTVKKVKSDNGDGEEGNEEIEF